MVAVTVVKGFTFTHSFVRDPKADDGSPHPTLSSTDDPMMHAKDEYIPVGIHDMPESMANNWYVQAHSDKPPLVIPRPGTPEYAGYQIAAARRRQLVEAAIEQEALYAAAEVRQDALLSGRIAENEEQAHAETIEQEAAAAEEAAKNEAVRTGRRVALPQRRPSSTAPVAPVLPPREAAPVIPPRAPAEPPPGT